MSHHSMTKEEGVGLSLWEEIMIKSCCHRGGIAAGSPQEADAVRKGCVHLVIPSADRTLSFSKRIKKEMARAAKSKFPLKVVVGCLVDEDCTTGSLYNSEDVPYFNAKMFPWVRAFHLADGHPVLYHFDERNCFSPAGTASLGKKLLLVEMDSRFKTSGTLPNPTGFELSKDGVDCGSLTDPVTTVLVSVPFRGPQWDVLVRKHKASIYKVKGQLAILAVPFGGDALASTFLREIAKDPKGVFAMNKAELYGSKTLTLTVATEVPTRTGTRKIHVSADELYFLTNATGILPIGGNRFRIATEMPMLKVAQVLHFQNSYIQNDCKKFLVLRDDKNGYVMLDTKKSPRVVHKYYRLDPPPAASVDKPRDRTLWFSIVNLPNGVVLDKLLEALKALEWWPGSDLLIDRSKFLPTAWFSVQDENDEGKRFPTVIRLFSRPLILMPGVPPPQSSFSSQEQPEADAVDIKQLHSCGSATEWAPRGKTKLVVAAKYQTGRSRAPTLSRPGAKGPSESKSGSAAKSILTRPSSSKKRGSVLKDKPPDGNRRRPTVDLTAESKDSGQRMPQIHNGGLEAKREPNVSGKPSDSQSRRNGRSHSERTPAHAGSHRLRKRKVLGGLASSVSPLVEDEKGCDPPEGHTFRNYTKPQRPKQQELVGVEDEGMSVLRLAKRRFVSNWHRLTQNQ